MESRGRRAPPHRTRRPQRAGAEGATVSYLARLLRSLSFAPLVEFAPLRRIEPPRRGSNVHAPVDLHFLDYLGPALAGLVFIAVMSLLKEPTRRIYNAVFAAGASGVYMSGGFGGWEVP